LDDAAKNVFRLGANLAGSLGVDEIAGETGFLDWNSKLLQAANVQDP
jgi:hypothetical protein